MALPAVLASLIPSLVNKAVDIFDRKFQTDGEKEAARMALILETEQRLQSAWDEEQKQISARHHTDMISDSWLSKNIRPLALVYLMALFTLAFFFNVNDPVLEMLRDLLMTVFVFYFGSRTLEKVVNVVKGGPKA